MRTDLRTPLLSLFLGIGTLAIAQPGAPLNQKDGRGLKQGTWSRTWADSDKLRYTGQFKDDKPVGRFTYYAKSGQVESIVDHHATGNASHARHFHPNGKLMAEGRYVGEAKDSIWTYFDGDGRKRSAETWKSGVQDGEQTTWTADGKVAERVHLKGGKRHGALEQYYPGGQLQHKSTYVNGEPEGLMTWYYASGKKEIEGKAVNGDRDGSWYYFHEDGSVQIQVLYAQGTYVKDRKENGVFKTYYDDEQLKSEHTYKGGKLNGPFAEYLDNGRIVEKEVVLGPDAALGRKDVERVFEGQTKKREGTYVDDQLHGEVKEYDDKGRVVRTVRYTNGTAATP